MGENYNLRILGTSRTTDGKIEYRAELSLEGLGFATAVIRSGCKLPVNNTIIPVVAQMPFYGVGGYLEVPAVIPKGASEDSGISKGFEGRSLEIILLPEGL